MLEALFKFSSKYKFGGRFVPTILCEPYPVIENLGGSLEKRITITQELGPCDQCNLTAPSKPQRGYVTVQLVQDRIIRSVQFR